MNENSYSSISMGALDPAPNNVHAKCTTESSFGVKYSATASFNPGRYAKFDHKIIYNHSVDGLTRSRVRFQLLIEASENDENIYAYLYKTNEPCTPFLRPDGGAFATDERHGVVCRMTNVTNAQVEENRALLDKVRAENLILNNRAIARGDFSPEELDPPMKWSFDGVDDLKLAHAPTIDRGYCELVSNSPLAAIKFVLQTFQTGISASDYRTVSIDLDGLRVAMELTDGEFTDNYGDESLAAAAMKEYMVEYVDYAIVSGACIQAETLSVKPFDYGVSQFVVLNKLDIFGDVRNAQNDCRAITPVERGVIASHVEELVECTPEGSTPDFGLPIMTDVEEAACLLTDLLHGVDFRTTLHIIGEAGYAFEKVLPTLKSSDAQYPNLFVKYDNIADFARNFPNKISESLAIICADDLLTVNDEDKLQSQLYKLGVRKDVRNVFVLRRSTHCKRLAGYDTYIGLSTTLCTMLCYNILSDNKVKLQLPLLSEWDDNTCYGGLDDADKWVKGRRDWANERIPPVNFNFERLKTVQFLQDKYAAAQKHGSADLTARSDAAATISPMISHMFLNKINFRYKTLIGMCVEPKHLSRVMTDDVGNCSPKNLKMLKCIDKWRSMTGVRHVAVEYERMLPLDCFYCLIDDEVFLYVLHYLNAFNLLANAPLHCTDLQMLLCKFNELNKQQRIAFMNWNALNYRHKMQTSRVNREPLLLSHDQDKIKTVHEELGMRKILKDYSAKFAKTIPVIGRTDYNRPLNNSDRDSVNAHVNRPTRVEDAANAPVPSVTNVAPAPPRPNRKPWRDNNATSQNAQNVAPAPVPLTIVRTPIENAPNLTQTGRNARSPAQIAERTKRRN